MRDVLTLRQIRAIVAVADAGSFGGAAQILGTSQPNVSGAVSSAERQLGCELFSRRPVTPTADCLSVLPRMRAVLAEAARLDAGLELLGGGRRVFRMAVPATLRLVYERRILDLWGREFPRVSCVLMEGEDDEIQQWLSAGIVDAGILIDPGPELLGEEAVVVVEDAYEGVIQRDHPLAGEERIDLDDLLDDRLVLSDSVCRRDVEALCWSVRPSFRPELLVRDMNALLAMVSAGRVVTILPSICEPILPAGTRPIALEPEVRRSLVATPARGADGSRRELFSALVGSLASLGLAGGDS
ncbi:MAG: LysR family transcriptional regulator [Acidipropionibacterium sp.]|jgi:DNA-binding transcriptional LysR family regulator|nr:LysR family transcriptional regulator [Acidipropionibacterium sp.]